MGSALKSYGTRKYHKGYQVVHKFKHEGNWYISCIYPKEHVETITQNITINKKVIASDERLEDSLGGNREYLGR